MTIIVKKIGSESFELDVRVPRIVSIKLEQGMLKQLDDAWKKAGYKSRSDFIRDAIKIYMELLEEVSKHSMGRGETDQNRVKTAIIREELLKILSQRSNIE